MGPKLLLCANHSIHLSTYRWGTDMNTVESTTSVLPFQQTAKGNHCSQVISWSGLMHSNTNSGGLGS
jgi:hypothetical protein